MFLGVVFYAGSDFLAADYSAAQFYILCLQRISATDWRAKLFLSTGLTSDGLSLLAQSDNLYAAGHVGEYAWHNYVTMDANGDVFTVTIGDVNVFTTTDTSIVKTDDRCYWGPVFYSTNFHITGSYTPIVASENPSDTNIKYYWKFWVRR